MCKQLFVSEKRLDVKRMIRGIERITIKSIGIGVEGRFYINAC